jgi:hypothetical protein
VRATFAHRLCDPGSPAVEKVLFFHVSSLGRRCFWLSAFESRTKEHLVVKTSFQPRMTACLHPKLSFADARGLVLAESMKSIKKVVAMAAASGETSFLIDLPHDSPAL